MNKIEIKKKEKWNPDEDSNAINTGEFEKIIEKNSESEETIKKITKRNIKEKQETEETIAAYNVYKKFYFKLLFLDIRRLC